MSCTAQNDLDITQKLTPLEKLISSDRLSYLPNLYYRQYRAMEMLTFLRGDFPAQKVLLPRPTTTHDYVLEQAQLTHFKLTEEIKYRKAICFHLAKCAKDEFIKRQYKKEERNLFQRVVFSQLAEGIKNRFNEQLKQVSNKKNGKSSIEPSKPQKHHKNDDDIFIDRQSQNALPAQDNQDIFGDFLNMQPQQKAIVEDPIRITKDYISAFSSANFEALSTTQRQVNRKLCLKKINQNLRKRNKAKTQNDTDDRKLSSASVAITAIMNQEPENRPSEELIDIISDNEYLAQQPRTKKRKEQSFDLKWSDENLQLFSSYNPKFEISKGKFDEAYLSLSVTRQNKNYEKIFQKNISAHKTFPPSVNSIPGLQKKFTKNKYYNQLPDREYEDFVISHSKKKIFEKFKKCAPFVLSDGSTQQFEGENINLAKLFITADGPYSDRIIYKVNNNRLSSVSSIPQRSALTRQQLSQLAYFVRKYLGLFGSNWKLIHLFISIHPLFSQMFLNKQQIQQYHQIPKRQSNKNSLSTLQLLDSKVLPFTIYNSFGYDEFTSDIRVEDINEDHSMDIETPEETTDQFNFDKYQSMLDQPLKSHQTPKQYVFQKTAKSYQLFAKDLKFPSMSQSKVDLVEDIDKIIAEFQGKTQFVDVESKETPKVTWCFEWVPEKLRNKIKPLIPFRKRKSISEKVSELVTILHKLKQRLQAPVARPPQPQNNAPTKTPSNPPQPRLTPTPSIAPQPSAPKNKMIPRNQAPVGVSKDKPAGQPKSRKPKKKDGKDDDDK